MRRRGTQSQTRARHSKVLAERNPPVAAVGAWVESGQDIPCHPSLLASLTDRLQAENQQDEEECLQTFLHKVRLRVAQHAYFGKRRRQPHKTEKMMCGGRPLHPPGPPSTTQGESGTCTPRVEYLGPAWDERGDDQPQPQKAGAPVTQVRQRLAACGLVPGGGLVPELPGGTWAASRPPAEDEQSCASGSEVGRDIRLQSRHRCPLVHHQVAPQRPASPLLLRPGSSCSDLAHSNTVKSPHEARQDTANPPTAPRVLWPLCTQQQLKKQQQAQFQAYRRLIMNMEREKVKEHRRQRRHLSRLESIKREKEEVRDHEEKRLEHLKRLQVALEEKQQRELLILERLRLEEEEGKEGKEVLLEEKTLQQKQREATRLVEAQRALLRQRLAGQQGALPPLCCCGQDFWDAHPEHCANNCVFYNNPQAYVQALRSAALSLEVKDVSRKLHWAPSSKMASTPATSPGT